MYYYGRSHTPPQRYKGNRGTVPIAYEIYCNGLECNKSLLRGRDYTDSPLWFINPDHNATFGKVYSITQKLADRVIDKGTTLYKTVLEYDGSRGYPYKTTMQQNSSKWLIYDQFNLNHKNEFTVEFLNVKSEWVGKDNAHNVRKKEASLRTHRRSMW